MNEARSPDIAVVGGGIIGAASAYALAREGLQVRLFEQDRVGAHASGGSAGILSTRDWEPGTPFYQLGAAGLDRHPVYATRLLEETGIDVQCRLDGMLVLPAPDEMAAIASALPTGSRLLDGHELHELEPNIGERWEAALFYPGHGQVNTGRLTQALAEAAARRGVTIHEGVRVTGLITEGDAVRGVRTTSGEVRAEQVVLAAGPWSGLLSDAIGRTLPVFPVKGQLVWAMTRPVALQHPVFAGCYLVPKYDMGIALGANQELAGFDETPTLGPTMDFIATAIAACPMLRDAALSRVWASLRPATPDGFPILGPVEGRPGLIMATGHFAHGIHLSLITAELVSNWVLDRPQPFDVRSFNVERFAQQPDGVTMSARGPQ